MNIYKKRVLSFVLAFAMILGLMPCVTLVADAATTANFTAFNVDGLTVSVTENATSDGTAVWRGEANGLTGTLTGKLNSGRLNTTSGKSKTVLTLKNTIGCEAELSFELTKKEFKGTVTVSAPEGSDYVQNGNKHKMVLQEDDVVTITLEVSEHSTFTMLGDSHTPNAAEITLTYIQLVVDNTVKIDFGEATNGSYTVAKADGAAVDTSVTLSAQSTDRFILTATPAEGYAFSGWYYTPEGSTEEAFYSGAIKATDVLFAKSGTLVPKFVIADSGIWNVNGAVFNDFGQAVSAARNTAEKVVALNQDYLLTENLTIPEGITVLIPFDEANTVGGSKPEVCPLPAGANSGSLLPYPKAYRTLTLAEGVSIVVNGNLEVGAKHYAAYGGGVYGGLPVDYYGEIVMADNSTITVQNGGILYAWGYVTGSGTVTAKSGAKVYEEMQVADYRGGSITTFIMLPQKIFPFDQYYIQNVEVRETIEAGASLLCRAGIQGSGDLEAYNVDFMGSTDAMFTLSSGAKVTKYYDAATDRLVLESEGNISMNAISIMDQNTSAFVLPFNHNITVNILSGTATVNQDLMLQPGAVINVSEGAELTLASGKKMHLMAASNWGNYIHGKKIQQVYFVPNKGGTPNIRQANITGDPIRMQDAKININGTLTVYGALYSSASSAGIVTVGETGKVVFAAKAPTSTEKIRQITGVEWTSPGMVDITMSPISLINRDNSTVDTKGVAAGTTYNYCSECGKWYTGDHRFTVVFMNGSDQFADGVYCKDAVPAVGSIPSKEYNGNDDHHNYDFVGWATSEGGAPLSELPAVTANATYYAIFKLSDHNGRFVYKSNEDGTHTKMHQCCGAVADATETCTDHVCDLCNAVVGAHEYVEGKCICGDTQKFVITWVGSNTTAERQLVYGAAIEAPGFTLDGHTLIGWATSEGGEVVTLPTTATSDATYYAVFVKNLTVELNGGNVALNGSLSVLQGNAYSVTITPKACYKVEAGNITVRVDNVEYTGFTFENGVLTIPAEAVTGDISIAVNATENHQHATYGCDETNHWSVCTCGAVFETVAHDFTNGNCVCGAEKPVEILYGDADGDGEITMLDAIILEQYLNEYDVTLDEAAADVDGDGEITMLDAIILQQYLNEYDVTLGPV